MNRLFTRTIGLTASLSLLVFVLVAGCSQEQAKQTETKTAEPAMSVAVVDEARIFNESNAGLEGVKMLNELNKSLREQLAGMQEAAQGNGTDADVANFRGAVQRYQEIMNNQQRALYDAVQEKYVTVLAEYRQAKGISVVFGQENALSFDSAVDITDDVIAALNAAEVELPQINATEYTLTPEQPAAEAPAMSEETAQEKPEAAEEAPAENATEAPAAENASEANATQ